MVAFNETTAMSITVTDFFRNLEVTTRHGKCDIDRETISIDWTYHVNTPTREPPQRKVSQELSINIHPSSSRQNDKRTLLTWLDCCEDFWTGVPTVPKFNTVEDAKFRACLVPGLFRSRLQNLLASVNSQGFCQTGAGWDPFRSGVLSLLISVE